MRELIAEYITTASTRRTVAAIVETPENAAPAVLPRARVAAADEAETPVRVATPVKTATASLPADPNEDLKPISVKTVKVKASTLQTAAIGSVAVAPPPAPAPVAHKPTPPAPVAAAPAVVTASIAPAAAIPAQPAPVRTATIDAKASIPSPAPLPTVRSETAAKDAAESTAKLASTEPEPRTVTPQRATRSGWIVQVGALDSVEAAKDRLAAARSKAINLLGRADAFTEPVTKGDKTLHRARFAGLDRDHAEAACKTLKRADIVCLAIKN
jgi:D-alanyl-D-alanine carboxypeptidase